MLRFFRIVFITLLIVPLSGFTEKDEVRVYKAPKQHEDSSQPTEKLSSSGEQSPKTILSWNVPDGWKQDSKPGALQLVRISVPPSEPEQKGAQASIVILGGKAGGIPANVNRWRGQAGLGPQEEGIIYESAQTLTSQIGTAKWFYIEGQKISVISAVIEEPTRSIFVKLIGDAKTAKENKSRFVEFASSLHYKP